MYSIIVKNQLHPNAADEYLAAMCINAQASVCSEAGCIRFDVLRDNDDNDVFYLYEIYTDAEALSRHKETDHYKTCRQQIVGLIKEQSVVRTTVVAVNPKNVG